MTGGAEAGGGGVGGGTLDLVAFVSRGRRLTAHTGGDSLAAARLAAALNEPELARALLAGSGGLLDHADAGRVLAGSLGAPAAAPPTLLLHGRADAARLRAAGFGYRVKIANLQQHAERVRAADRAYAASIAGRSAAVARRTVVRSGARTEARAAVGRSTWSSEPTTS